MAEARALIFAKYPTPGAVKTRMVPPLTVEQAAELHRAALASVCASTASSLSLTPILVCSPDDRLDDFRALECCGITDYWPQGDGDLGARLARATDRAFADGAERVILLGADSPTLPPERLDEALELLGHHEVVLGPSADGGYYLMALRKPLEHLFRGIDWGSHRVCAQTRARAEREGTSVAMLPEWYDLDRFDDLLRAQRDLACLADDAPAAMIELRRVVDACVGTRSKTG